MESALPGSTFPEKPSSCGGWRGTLVEAAAYWEPLRLPYNVALCGVALAWILATWPHFRPAFTIRSLPPLGFLALLANLCYLAAYAVDVPMQHSPFRAAWRRARWVLWLAGAVLAIVLENYWIADEIYPAVR
jgi:hypothetical protein